METAFSITLTPPAPSLDRPYDAVVFAPSVSEVLERVGEVIERDEDVAPGIWSGWTVQVNGRVPVMGA